jgi:tripartite motif-containing protein 2/3
MVTIRGSCVGRDEGQLWYPRKVTVVRSSGKFVVCDRGNERSRMQLFMRNGQFIKRIAIRYIDIVAGLAVNPSGENGEQYVHFSY